MTAVITASTNLTKKKWLIFVATIYVIQTLTLPRIIH